MPCHHRVCPLQRLPIAFLCHPSWGSRHMDHLQRSLRLLVSQGVPTPAAFSFPIRVAVQTKFRHVDPRGYYESVDEKPVIFTPSGLETRALQTARQLSPCHAHAAITYRRVLAASLDASFHVRRVVSSFGRFPIHPSQRGCRLTSAPSSLTRAR